VCGICGFVEPEPGPVRAAEALARTAAAMARTLRHRGPDAEGTWVDAGAGLALGHRRLAVQDPSPDGAQPMRSADGALVLAYNGEIYNFRALRGELERAGVGFRGHSDTEVLLEAIAAWGIERALERAEGMFAFALWDARARRLHLARDRVGKKPLYWARRGRALWFGSELKALRAHPRFSAEVDREALACFVRFSYVPAPHTIYRGVHKLEAGSRVSFAVDASGAGAPEPARFGPVSGLAARAVRDPFAGSPEAALDALDARLGDAVERRLVADVPLGALLSGGVDSALVVALMQERSAQPVRTFSVGYREAALDEGPHARRVAEHLGTRHTPLLVTPEEAREVIPRLPALYDEPFADTSQLPTALVCALARRHVTVALSGDGGDELFAGYPRYFRCAQRWRALRPLPLALRRLLADGARRVAPQTLERAADALEAPGLEALFAEANARHPAHWSLVRGARGTLAAAVAAPPAPSGEGPRDPLARLRAADLGGRLPESILVKVDRASMGVGLEVRSPLLDAEVIALALRIPTSVHVRGGRPKWLLRELLARRVPRALFERPKQGFGVPLGAWLRGPLRAWGEALLAPERLRREGFLDVARVRACWEEHLAGRDRRFLLWNLLTFQAWLEAGA